MLIDELNVMPSDTDADVAEIRGALIRLAWGMAKDWRGGRGEPRGRGNGGTAVDRSGLQLIGAERRGGTSSPRSTTLGVGLPAPPHRSIHIANSTAFGVGIEASVAPRSCRVLSAPPRLWAKCACRCRCRSAVP